MTADSRKIADTLTANYPAPTSKHFLSARQYVVQRFLKMRGRFREFLAYLSDVLLITLLDLILEELF